MEGSYIDVCTVIANNGMGQRVSACTDGNSLSVVQQTLLSFSWKIHCICMAWESPQHPRKSVCRDTE